MKRTFLTPLILFFVLGSAAVNTMDSLSPLFKSSFYTLAIIVLGTLVLLSLFGKMKRE